MSAPTATTQRHRKFQWPLLFILAGFWVLFWGSVTPGTVVSGLAVALFVVMVYPLPPIVFDGTIHPVGMLRLIGRFLTDLVVASIQVAGMVLRKEHPTSAVIQVDLRSQSDLYMTLTGELLTLVPGSLVVEARRSTRTLFMHVIGIRDEADAERFRQAALDQERRVVFALGSQAELAAYREREEGERR
ncbi:Na+/H+ antiporter subunit E [Haloactinopolyspora sp.]|uniref:Na+/H+ antiporter subunit E n=1 Tax=Haloactinopolyspora sp. TaxID=1966353 RepID=UPI002602BC80|nr:Na+/H+ antiporter subunit E [Haloactinopolyspora sp.]